VIWSGERIPTTHTGSLPRPDDLVELLRKDANSEAIDRALLERRASEAVAESVQQQLDIGLDIVNDGEMSKISYSTYVTQRLSGYESQAHVPRRPRPDAAAFPRYAEWNARQQSASFTLKRYACTGPVSYIGQAQLQRDLTNLRDALSGSPAGSVFMTAASPGVISHFQPNQYYPTNDEYLGALADAMREEYMAIVEAGFVLQLDCPDFTRAAADVPGTLPKDLGKRIEAVNHAVRDIPPDKMRLHLCWGNYEGPHHTDVPLRELLPEVVKARPMYLSFEGANPRHEHEWNVFDSLSLPDDKVIIPGVLDSTTNYIEHPELVCQRLVRYAHRVGRERVVAGTDCGFQTFAGPLMVHPDITWAKLAAMVEGARLASHELWA